MSTAGLEVDGPEPTYDSIYAADGFALRVHEWLAERPALTVGLCHGYGEHAGRYAHVGHALTGRRISLVAADLRGHGLSQGRRGCVERFSDYLLDLDAIVQRARRRAEGGRVALMGHSMGGLITCAWLLEHEGADLAGVVLTSPMLGLRPGSQLLAWLMRPLSELAPTLGIDAWLSGSVLTRDPFLAQQHAADPLINRKVVLRTIAEALATAERVRERSSEFSIPTLLFYAGNDRIVSADVTERFARSLVMPDRTCERVPGAMHELLNELPEVRQRLIERITTWLLERARPH
jgi:alpha-beta hydrolase superfamily lysophospholipase